MDNENPNWQLSVDSETGLRIGILEQDGRSPITLRERPQGDWVAGWMQFNSLDQAIDCIESALRQSSHSESEEDDDDE